MSFKKTGKCSLAALLDHYLSLHQVCPEHAANMRRTVRMLGEQGVGSADRLTSSSVTAMCDAIQGATSTKANHRRIALTLWRHAVRQGWATGPVEARPVRVRLPVVRAWSDREIIRLLEFVKSSCGNMRSGAEKRVFWAAWTLLGYESGLRLGDLLGLRLDDFDDGFALLITQTSKTAERVQRSLSPECAQAVHDLFLQSPNGSLFSWALSRRHVKAQFSRLVHGAGLTGSVRWLRRTGATACEAQSPGSASRFLAHRSPGVAGRHYIDWSKVLKTPTAPRLER
jgi:integrase